VERTKKRVVIADDHPLVVDAIAQVFKDEGEFEVIGTAASGAQVAPLVARTNPDLVLLDLQMPVLDGLSCLALLREKHPYVTVVVFSGSEHREQIQLALSTGAAAYIAKSINPLDIPAMLRQALAGNVYYSTPRVDPGALAQIRRETQRVQAREETGLTARELEILTAVSEGLSNRQVGKKLFLSDQTVKFHLHNIYGKLGVSNRTEAAGVAHQLGLFRTAAPATS
jgi:two-component system nitrate/nitrite response regulator NarL